MTPKDDFVGLAVPRTYMKFGVMVVEVDGRVSHVLAMRLTGPVLHEADEVVHLI